MMTALARQNNDIFVIFQNIILLVLASYIMGQIRDKLLLKKIALTIKSLREELNETQDDVYVATNIHIGRIETARANISVSTLAALCTYFKISLVEFFKKVDYDK
jgi:hypothetical protein